VRKNEAAIVVVPHGVGFLKVADAVPRFFFVTEVCG